MKRLTVTVQTELSLVYDDDDTPNPDITTFLQNMTLSKFITEIDDMGSGMDKIIDWEWTEISRKVEDVPEN